MNTKESRTLWAHPNRMLNGYLEALCFVFYLKVHRKKKIISIYSITSMLDQFEISPAHGNPV